MIFGITGQTGSGKSTVSEQFRALGVDVLDADFAARVVCEPGTPCLAEIIESFGRDMLLPNGELNRRRLGAVVFSDPEKLERLSKITHYYIREWVLQKIRQSKSMLCAIDGAVLIGSNMESLCRAMVAVVAEPDIRKKRIMARDGLSEEEAVKRIAAQEDEDFYRKHADFIIENNSGIQALEQQTKQIYDQIKQWI